MFFEKIQLEQDERVLKVYRKHWFVLFVLILVYAFMLSLPFVAVLFIGSLGIYPTILAEYISFTQLSVFVTAFWSLLIGLGFVSSLTDYYLDLWCVTTHRVIAVDQRGFFHRSVSSFRLERLQDVSIVINGLIATILNYGSIRTETAGHSEAEFIFTTAPDPRAIKALVLDAADARLRKQNISPSEGI